MASLELLLQAVTSQTHADVLKKILQMDKPSKVLGSVAFVRQAGVDVLEAELRNHSGVTQFFVGIRNDITSVQGLHKLIDLGVSLFAVDTGSRDIIFHPKPRVSG